MWTRTALTRSVAAALCSGFLCLQNPSASSARQETSANRVSWGPFKGRDAAEIARLDEYSREASAGVTLPSGVRVVDLVEGDGPQPVDGSRVWVHYKLWASGFRVGQAADYSFADGSPYDFVLGAEHAAGYRLPRGTSEGMANMREGGWRRIFVPDAFDDGLRKVSRGPQVRRLGCPSIPTNWC